MGAFRFRLLLGALLMIACSGVAAEERSDQVLLLLSDDAAPYREFSASLQGAATQVRFRSQLAGVLDPPREPSFRLVVAAGARAFTAALTGSSSTPLVAALLPHRVVEREMDASRTARQPVTAVYLDQPPRRQLALIEALFTGRARIASVFGPDSTSDWQTLQKASARDLALSFNGVRVVAEGDIYTAMIQVLPRADVFLALPDSVVFNARTAQNVLLTTYRYRVPVVAFAPSYVRAGALAAAYSTPVQIGRQVAAIVEAVLAGRELPPPAAPSDFSIAVNPEVARAFGITIDSEAVLRDHVRDLEAR